MNVGNIHDCFGCGVCAIACGRKIIDIHLNKEGFYEPYLIDEDKCTDCGLCVDVCSFSHDNYSLKKCITRSYAAWSKNDDVRQFCSSGGVGYEVARMLIKGGYKVCGVRYNVELNRAEHYIASNEEELKQSVGSKYIQSYTLDCFRQIKRNEKYLVVGTPCQIDSFRRYIQKYKCEDNFVLMDFFCHGVPSKLMWDKYVRKVEREIGEFSSVAWRCKKSGWHDSWVMSFSKKNKDLVYYSYYTKGDLFYSLFLGHFCIGKQCHNNCRFKCEKSSADIRIGDFWGKIYSKDEEGVSAVISLTEKGDNILNSVESLVFKPHTIEEVTEGQQKSNAEQHDLRNIVMFAFRHNIFISKSVLALLIKLNYKYNRLKRLL